MALLAVAGQTAPTPSFPNGIRLETLAAGSFLIRIHHRDNGPIWFGPKPGLDPVYRFDAPGGEYRTLYAAMTLEGAFVETILHGKAGQTILDRAVVNARSWSELQLSRSLKLAKLHEDGLFWHGTDSRISSALVYAEPRRIALALHNECPDLDGITYRSRHNNGEVCLALFDRVQLVDLVPQSARLFATETAELSRLMDKYGVSFSPGASIPPP